MMDKADAAGGKRLALEYAVGYRRRCARHMFMHFQIGMQPLNKLARTVECLRRNHLANQCHCLTPLRDAGFKCLYRGYACRRLPVCFE